MNCPKCAAVMEEVGFHGVVVDRCTGCRGLWFDLLEHDDLKLMKGSEVIDDGDAERGARLNKVVNIDCPKCKTRMIQMVDAKQPHIHYESCTSCHGAFFDAGEFADFKEENIADFFKWWKAKG